MSEDEGNMDDIWDQMLAEKKRREHLQPITMEEAERRMEAAVAEPVHRDDVRRMVEFAVGEPNGGRINRRWFAGLKVAAAVFGTLLLLGSGFAVAHWIESRRSTDLMSFEGATHILLDNGDKRRREAANQVAGFVKAAVHVFALDRAEGGAIADRASVSLELLSTVIGFGDSEVRPSTVQGLMGILRREQVDRQRPLGERLRSRDLILFEAIRGLRCLVHVASAEPESPLAVDAGVLLSKLEQLIQDAKD